MIAATWIVPVLLFFPSIIGYQYIVGKRTVPRYQCHVQYMDDPIFNFLLQVDAVAVVLPLYRGRDEDFSLGAKIEGPKAESGG